jgi:hypothetical protein
VSRLFYKTSRSPKFSPIAFHQVSVPEAGDSKILTRGKFKPFPLSTAPQNNQQIQISNHPSRTSVKTLPKMKTNHKRTIEVQNPNSALLSRQLVAKKLGVSAMTVKRYQNRGLLNPIYLSSRAIRYRPEDVENFIWDACA